MKRKGLSAEKLLEIKKSVAEDLSFARSRLLVNYPFIGSICLGMDIIPVRDVRCRTMCTDGSRIFADCDFSNKLTDAERIFVIGHEVWHAVLMHMTRRQTRDALLFNIAADKEVNYMLSNDGFRPPKDILLPDSDEKGKSAEEIYEKLLSKIEKSNNSGGTGGKNGEISGQFDEHIYSDSGLDDDAEDGHPAVEDTWGEVGFDSDFCPRVNKDFQDDMRRKIISEAQRIERMKGNLPAHISGLIEKIVRPEIKWQELLARFVTKCYNSGIRQWLPPNRRYVYKGLYMQSRRSESVNGIVAIDTSGSCVDDLPKFFGELTGLVGSFGKYDLTVICADADIQKVEKYDETNILPSEIKFEWKGGGGTDYDCVFEYIEENGLSPDFLIYIGDGYANISVKKPGYPVMWLITRDGDADFVDWGEKIKFRNK